MKIAICISGHLRTFDRCLSNIRENIFEPIRNNFEVDIYLSTWKDVDSDNYKNIDNIIFESEEQITFSTGSKNYLKYPTLCCPTTPDNATSMWYKCKRVFNMTNDSHDVILRIRPDIIYENKINIDNLIKSFDDGKIYMAESPGRYMEVTLGMLDPFVFGNRKVMSVLMQTYDNIPNLINNNDIPHTAEGFLYHTIKNIPLERIPFKYSILRESGQIDKLYID